MINDVNIVFGKAIKSGGIRRSFLPGKIRHHTMQRLPGKYSWKFETHNTRLNLTSIRWDDIIFVHNDERKPEEPAFVTVYKNVTLTLAICCKFSCIRIWRQFAFLFTCGCLERGGYTVGIQEPKGCMAETAKDILSTDYESFAQFFLRLIVDCLKIEQTDENHYFFVAFLTRRCHVLLEIFLEIFRSFCVDGISAGSLLPFIEEMDYDEIRRIVDEHFLTDSNLITQAGKVADFYRETGRFPKIIILDEIILHGRAVNSLLLKYESAVIKRLEQFDPQMSEEKRDFLIDRLAHLTELRIYAQNNEPLLLLSRYRHRLHHDRLYDPVQIRKLSQKFAVLILNSDVNNVAYSWNFKFNSLLAKKWKDISYPSNFARMQTNMKSIRQTCFLWLYPNAVSPKAICTLRWKSTYAPLCSTLAVPFIIFDRMPRSNLLRLHKRICKDLQDLQLDFLTDYEDYDIGEMDSCYLRWVSETNDLILSYLMFRRFCEAGGPHNIWLPGVQFSILNRNFKLFSPAGQKHGSIENDLKKIWSWNPPCPDQLEQYFEILLEDAQPIWKREDIGDVPDAVSINENSYEEKKLFRAVEDAISFIGYEAEQNACEKYSSGIFFSDEILADWGRRYSISETVALCENCLKSPCRSKTEDIYSILALIVQAMDIGIIGMNPEYEKSSDTLYTMVRAGEHSLFIKPERYQEYIPVLSEISRRCRESQLDLRTELKRFIHCLPQDDLDVTAEELYDFMEGLRSVKQEVKDWDFRLFTRVNIHNDRHCHRARNALSKIISRQYHFLQEYRKI